MSFIHHCRTECCHSTGGLPVAHATECPSTAPSVYQSGLILSVVSHQPSSRNTPCASLPPSTHVHQLLGDNVGKAKQKSAANDCEKEKEGGLSNGWLRFVQCHGPTCQPTPPPFHPIASDNLDTGRQTVTKQPSSHTSPPQHTHTHFHT
jgi:hypothetical protein